MRAVRRHVTYVPQRLARMSRLLSAVIASPRRTQLLSAVARRHAQSLLAARIIPYRFVFVFEAGNLCGLPRRFFGFWRMGVVGVWFGETTLAALCMYVLCCARGAPGVFICISCRQGRPRLYVCAWDRGSLGTPAVFCVVRKGGFLLKY